MVGFPRRHNWRGEIEFKETDGFAFLQLGDNLEERFLSPIEILNCKGRFSFETPLGQSSELRWPYLNCWAALTAIQPPDAAAPYAVEEAAAMAAFDPQNLVTTRFPAL